MANLINLERVSKSYGVRPLLDNVSLGISLGERVGIVGRNGDGKTTLLEVMTGIEQPDAGRVSRTRGVEIGYLHQGDELVDTHTVREAVLAGRAGPRVGGRPHDPPGRRGAARGRRPSTGPSSACPVASVVAARWPRCCSSRHDLIILDEPTNHLDVEAVAWLAAHLVSLPSALIVVTHDRWFLDEVCQTTWEVHDGAVDSYEGGYAAYVLAKAERSAPGRGHRDASAEPRPQGARLAAARRRRRVRRSRSSASTRPTP